MRLSSEDIRVVHFGSLITLSIQFYPYSEQFKAVSLPLFFMKGPGQSLLVSRTSLFISQSCAFLAVVHFLVAVSSPVITHFSHCPILTLHTTSLRLALRELFDMRGRTHKHAIATNSVI